MENEQKKISDNFVYHYCSLETFLKIVQNKTIRFSDLSKTNDAEEIKFIYNLLNDYLKRHRGADKEIDYITFAEFRDTILYQVYSLSMSYEYDKAQLWLNYANPGIALGFDKTELINYFKSLNYKNIRFQSGDTRYVDIDNLGRYESFFKKVINSYYHQVESKTKRIYSSIFSHYSARLKNKGWEDEKEFRIYFKIRKQDAFSVFSGNKGDKLIREYKIKNNSLVSYYDFPIIPGLIKKIFISNNLNITKEEMYEFLSNYGFKVNKSAIDISKVKIR